MNLGGASYITQCKRKPFPRLTRHSKTRATSPALTGSSSPPGHMIRSPCSFLNQLQAIPCAVPPAWVTSFRMNPRATPSCKSVKTCLPIVAFLTIQSKMTTYPQHPLSPSTSSMPSNTALLLPWFTVLSARTQAP